MKEYECRTLYPANEADGRLVAIDFARRLRSEDEKKLKFGDFLLNSYRELESKKGWKNNSYNLASKYYVSNIHFFEEPKNEDLILLMNQFTVINSSHLRKNSVKGIIIDYNEIFYENPFSSHSKHAYIYARESGIPAVGMKNATDYLIPGQKITIKPRIPAGKIVVDD